MNLQTTQIGSSIMSTISFDEFQNKAIPSEEQITSRWKQRNEQPLVSVLCTTYNHIKYIDYTLRGFLLQRTSFPFEIIIHDDASTDGTREKLIEYQEKYPGIIRTILQTDNQYSQGKQLFPIPAKIARGQYCALCDGDDFWIDEEKLSRQIHALERNRDCTICFHKTRYCSGENTRIDPKRLKDTLKEIAIYPVKPSIIKASAVIVGNGDYIPTASIVVRRNMLINIPDWFDACPVGDYFIQVLASHPAGAIFIPREMSVYRTKTSDSWTSTTYADPARAAKFYYKMRSSLEILNQHLNRQYSMEIWILRNTLTLLGICHNYLKPNIKPQANGVLATHHAPDGRHDIPERSHPAIELLFYRITKNLILAWHRITAKKVTIRPTEQIQDPPSPAPSPHTPIKTES